MRLWLVRHAAIRQAGGICYGAQDLPADPAPTAAAAARLAGALPDALNVVCSPLQRCTALAAQLNMRRPSMRPRIDARLAEMNFGDWEGKPWDAIGETAISAWTADFHNHRPGGGESLADVMARVGSAWREALEHDGDVLWITHAGVIKAAQQLAAGQGDITRADQWPVQAVPHGEWVVLAPPAATGR